jgi:uncharacterized protein YcbK (DUF882 family)
VEDAKEVNIPVREKIAPNFYRDEFACPCCGADNIDYQLVQKLQKLRSAYGRPLVITSGVRCGKHNEEVGGEKYSSHLYGFAVDIACSDSSQRWELIALCMRMFRRVGKYDSWIHVDIDPQKPQGVFW